MSKEFYLKLSEIQRSLNAPKNQYNSFGKYRYRSCEDILEGVKPLLNGLFLSISDDIVVIGERYYVKATATITDGSTSHSATAMAREEENKKGMDSAQVTGATSSYARKYCLNGLFGIDDSKDADTDEHRQQQNNSKNQIQNQAAQQPQEVHHVSPQSAEEALKEFADKATLSESIDELKAAYKDVWPKLGGSKSHEERCTETYRTRGKELQTQQAA